MILTHIWDRIHCVWRWRVLTYAARIALPRVTALALACGGPTTRLPAEPALAPPPAHERPVAPPVVWRDAPSPSILVYLPPPPRVDVRPAVAPDDDRAIWTPVFPGKPNAYEVDMPKLLNYGHPPTDPVFGSDVPEPGTLALLLVGLVGVAVGRRG